MSESLSPMMQLYMETKEQYKDCILFYRIGDFFEMFFDDAKVVSKELELTLTGKACGLPERAPMCGVPAHAADSYITRLVQRGFKVAVCDQVEDPATAKGLVKREVIRVVTPGTNIAELSLDEDRNNYLASVFYAGDHCGLSICDVSTGRFLVTEVPDEKTLRDELLKFSPSELIGNSAFSMSGYDLTRLSERGELKLSVLDAHHYDERVTVRELLAHFGAASPEGLGLADFPLGTIAAGALLQYLYETQKNSLTNLTHITPYLSDRYMLLDGATRRNLELTRTMRDKQKSGSLLWVLDKTHTAMGARKLIQFIEQPLIDADMIRARLDAVDVLCRENIDRDELREYLKPVYDLERLITRLNYKTANARDLLAIRGSLKMLPSIAGVLQGILSFAPEGCQELSRIARELGDYSELTDLLDRALEEEPPLTVKEGGLIKEGFDADIDHLRKARTEGRSWLMAMEEEERERTGIRNLRIRYNKVFGYYLEVTNSFLGMVPEDYIRKQTLTGSERFTTPRLKELEDTILNAQDKLNTLEYDLFCELRDKIAARTQDLQVSADALARLDVFASLSLVAERYHYVKPVINEKGIIDIRDGRHPVVERMLDGDFVANDTYLDSKKKAISIITGPNMAGKSTYMRQTALIALMAQIGSFVPAGSANLCVVDRIFTRVGASDDLGSGQSTFMVEMNEVANILRNATPKSLIILDEIGRGTATYDGLSIAWAVVEHIANKRFLGAKTLFATHYHELTELEGRMDNVNNYCVAVKENGDDIVFLRKIIPGGADRSYGIQVAKLAGIPDLVIDRAKEILSGLLSADMTDRVQSLVKGSGSAPGKPVHYDDVDLGQLSLQDTVRDEDVLHQLQELDISNLTPLDALNTLYKLQNQLKNRW